MSHVCGNLARFDLRPECEHLLAAALHPRNLLLQILHTTCGVGGDGFVPLLEAPADIMKSLDCLVQRLVEVREQSLKTTYAHATLIGQCGRVGSVVARRVGDKEAYSPEVLAILNIQLTILGGDDGQRLAHRVGNLRLDMLRHGLDVIHHTRHVGEDDVVLALQDIVGRSACGGDYKGVVDKSLAQRVNLRYLALDGKLRGNLKKFFLVHIFLFLLFL